MGLSLGIVELTEVPAAGAVQAEATDFRWRSRGRCDRPIASCPKFARQAVPVGRVWSSVNRQPSHLPSGRFKDRHESEQMLESSDRSWRQAGLGQWSVRLRMDASESSATANEIVGTGGVTVSNIGVWNLGYRLTPSSWGAGIATELARASIRVASTMEPLTAVTARVLTSNPASQRLLAHVGMHLIWEGSSRELSPDCGAIGRQIYADRPNS